MIGVGCDGCGCPKASPRGLPPRKAACMRATGGQRVAEVDCQRQDGLATGSCCASERHDGKRVAEVNEFVVNSQSMEQPSSQANSHLSTLNSQFSFL